MKQYQVTISKITELDHFENGCDPDTTQDHGVIFKFKSSDLQMLKDRIKTHADIDLSDAEEVEGRLETSKLETSEGYTANSVSIKDWQDGRISLYNAQFSIYLSEIVETELNAEILKKD